MIHRIAGSFVATAVAAVLMQGGATAQSPSAVDSPEAAGFGAPADPAMALIEGAAPDPIAARASSTCADGRVCFWTQADYAGDKATADADDAMVDRSLFQWDRSAKNRFGARKVQIKNVYLNVVECLNPGQNSSNLPASAVYFRIGSVNSSC